MARTGGLHIYSLWSISLKHTTEQLIEKEKEKKEKVQVRNPSFICWVWAVVLQVCGRKLHLRKVLMEFDLLFLSLEQQPADLEHQCASRRCLP